MSSYGTNPEYEEGWKYGVREGRDWQRRRDRARAAKVRATHKAKLRELRADLQALQKAARRVLTKWPTGQLAEAATAMGDVLRIQGK